MELISNAQRILAVAQKITKGADDIQTMPEIKAQSENEYQVASSKAYFLLRQCGVTQGDAKEMVRGINADLKSGLEARYPLLLRYNLPLVADLRFQRDVTEAKHAALRDALRAWGDAMSGLQSVQRDFKELG